MAGLKTVEEVAPILRISDSTVRRLIKRGELPYTKVGGRYLFTEGNIAEFIARNTRNAQIGEPQ